MHYYFLYQSIRGQSKSTFENYLRRIALISLHLGRMPEDIPDDGIKEYLTALALSSKSPSRSSFKHKGNRSTTLKTFNWF